MKFKLLFLLTLALTIQNLAYAKLSKTKVVSLRAAKSTKASANSTLSPPTAKRHKKKTNQVSSSKYSKEESPFLLLDEIKKKLKNQVNPDTSKYNRDESIAILENIKKELKNYVQAKRDNDEPNEDEFYSSLLIIIDFFITDFFEIVKAEKDDRSNSKYSKEESLASLNYIQKSLSTYMNKKHNDFRLLNQTDAKLEELKQELRNYMTIKADDDQSKNEELFSSLLVIIDFFIEDFVDNFKLENEVKSDENEEKEFLTQLEKSIKNANQRETVVPLVFVKNKPKKQTNQKENIVSLNYQKNALQNEQTSQTENIVALNYIKKELKNYPNSFKEKYYKLTNYLNKAVSIYKKPKAYFNLEPYRNVKTYKIKPRMREYQEDESKYAPQMNTRRNIYEHAKEDQSQYYPENESDLLVQSQMTVSQNNTALATYNNTDAAYSNSTMTAEPISDNKAESNLVIGLDRVKLLETAAELICYKYWSKCPADTYFEPLCLYKAASCVSPCCAANRST